MAMTLVEKIQSDREWAEFFADFSDKNKSYIKLLSHEHPGLTVTQFKICVFLKAGYSTRNISEALHVSIRSVENHRYRLRKKMNIKPGENLFTYLMRYAS